MIRVLVVEDSPVVQEFLVYILNSDPQLRVIAIASDGEEALETTKRERPDVVTMDIHMPKVDGFQATRRIMETCPTPIVIVSGSSSVKEVATAFHAMEAGALAVVPRPMGIGHPEHKATAAELVRTVKLMSEVRLVRRWPRSRREALTTAVSGPPEIQLKKAPGEIKVVAVGASTGGPLALQTILSGLPRDFPVPVLVVQHMASGFVQGFVEWLSQTSRLSTRVATHGEPLLPGHAYVAPEGSQMKVQAGGVLWLTNDEPENGHRPSVSYLFRSVAELYKAQAVGVLLTGMGRDGAEELKRMKDKGAITIAQDKETSVVYGMPGEAVSLDAAGYILSPVQMSAVLTQLVNKNLAGSD